MHDKVQAVLDAFRKEVEVLECSCCLRTMKNAKTRYTRTNPKGKGEGLVGGSDIHILRRISVLLQLVHMRLPNDVITKSYRKVSVLLKRQGREASRKLKASPGKPARGGRCSEPGQSHNLGPTEFSGKCTLPFTVELAWKFRLKFLMETASQTAFSNLLKRALFLLLLISLILYFIRIKQFISPSSHYTGFFCFIQ